MTKNKKIGIWMDHSNAYLMEYDNNKIMTTNILSEMNHKENEERWDGHEKHIHSKEQSQQTSYYKKIGEKILSYQEVVIFGPTDARKELKNLIDKDHKFEGIKIEVLHSDKMTESQMHDFIRDYFG
jgi:acetyl-CoA carboxylase beta subunit